MMKWRDTPGPWMWITSCSSSPQDDDDWTWWRHVPWQSRVRITAHAVLSARRLSVRASLPLRARRVPGCRQWSLAPSYTAAPGQYNRLPWQLNTRTARSVSSRTCRVVRAACRPATDRLVTSELLLRRENGWPADWLGGRWYLVGGLACLAAMHQACIDQEPARTAPRYRHTQLAAERPLRTRCCESVRVELTLPGKLVAFKICNRRQLVIGVKWTREQW